MVKIPPPHDNGGFSEDWFADQAQRIEARYFSDGFVPDFADLVRLAATNAKDDLNRSIQFAKNIDDLGDLIRRIMQLKKRERDPYVGMARVCVENLIILKKGAGGLEPEDIKSLNTLCDSHGIKSGD